MWSLEGRQPPGCRLLGVAACEIEPETKRGGVVLALSRDRPCKITLSGLGSDNFEKFAHFSAIFAAKARYSSDRCANALPEDRSWPSRAICTRSVAGESCAAI